MSWPYPACGYMVHLDTKKLGGIRGVGKRFGPPAHRNRGIGWNFLTEQAVAFFASHGIAVHGS